MTFDLSNMPARIAALPRDRRGLPIPYVVMVDDADVPHFTMNDQHKVAAAAHFGLCAICGQRLGAYKCFVGGPGSAFHPVGRYFDGPVHQECGVFALHACPYLALSGSYARRVKLEKLAKRVTASAGKMLIAEDPTQHAPQPPVFVLGSCKAFRMVGKHYEPVRPWAQVRFFRAGVEIGATEARALAEADPTPATPFSTLKWQDQ